eukprot:gene15694-38737_t
MPCATDLLNEEVAKMLRDAKSAAAPCGSGSSDITIPNKSYKYMAHNQHGRLYIAWGTLALFVVSALSFVAWRCLVANVVHIGDDAETGSEASDSQCDTETRPLTSKTSRS